MRLQQHRSTECHWVPAPPESRSRWGRIQAPQPRVQQGTNFEDIESVAPNVHGARSCDPELPGHRQELQHGNLILKPQVPGPGNTRSTCPVTQRQVTAGSMTQVGVTITRPQ